MLTLDNWSRLELMAKRRKRKSANRKKWIIVISIVFLLAAGFLYVFYFRQKVADTFDKSNKYYVKGIDVSHHNPILDWNEVKNQNLHFTYIKATEGITHDDRNYLYNYKLAKENNIKVGSYHFYNFAVSGREQAKHFIKVAQCESGDLLPAIDVEHSPSNPYSKDTAYVKSVIKELQILEKELYEYYGYHPMVYTNMDCYKLYIKDRFPDNPIWICNLKGEPKDDVKNWVIWQFTHKGELPGIVGDIDFNYFRYSYERLWEISFP